ncbi:Phosphotransferase enzyme family protein [Nocardioides dokdonensis FR1436]|uniref:Phosphotransferase enzyme family protein n=1 Tax=Nocardioides dokdonensis FR1436 TaxID=1300347 RepID=A0A1A9GMT0_9ACTN|nr:Phosphotransferase enzyme family protein [Nocardioides dokdonensis FR1436]
MGSPSTDLSVSTQIDGLIDLVALRAWLDDQGVSPGRPLEVVGLLGGGTQNILLRLRRGSRDLVLRRGPRHLRTSTNDNLRREMRVLDGLSRTRVPHARLVADCPDEDILGGAAFYVMELVDGLNPTVEMPWAEEDVTRTRRLCFSTVEALAGLGEVDHEAVGLSGVGRPDGFLERQVARWRSELATYARFPEYQGPDLPAVAAIGDWLDDNRPADWTPGILHGDFHLANLLVDPSTAEVAAIVDWEMATIGDPLLDLGSLLATWPRPGRPHGVGWSVDSMASAVTKPELVQHYADRSHRDMSAIDWYEVLASWKLAIVIEGTHARACAGLAPRDTGKMLHAWAVTLLDQARVVAGV